MVHVYKNAGGLRMCGQSGNNKAEATFLCVPSIEGIFRTKHTYFGVQIHVQSPPPYVNQMTELYPLVFILFCVHFQHRRFHFKKNCFFLPFIKP